MIKIGETYFYIRPNGKVERGDARGFKVNEDNVLVNMRDKYGLLEWVDADSVHKTLGAALKAKEKSKDKWWKPW